MSGRDGLGEHAHGPAEIHFPDHHVDDESPAAGALDDAGWLQDNVVLTTVGIDIGSATSHLMFARLHLQRLARELSSRFVVVEREVLHRSPILLTPYRDDVTIDVGALGAFIHRAYAEAGLAREAIDTGAVILTGVALERANAAAVAGLFAAEGGRFVCASAGHGLEALLAAHGSGSVAASAASGETVLNVDIGGGTSKLALAIGGDVAAVSAIAVGARLIAFDARGLVARVERAGAAHAEAAGTAVRPGEPLSRDARARLTDRMVDALVAASHGRDLGAPLQLLPPLPRGRIDRLTFSGGVAEHLAGRTDADHGDLGRELAAALGRRAGELPAPISNAAEGIRATVVGASQFSVQLSGSTIHLADERLLPLRNLPVVSVVLGPGAPVASAVADAAARGLARADLAAGASAAYALRWRGEPRHRELRALADGLAAIPRGRGPLVVALEGDLAATLGRILVEECGVPSVIAIDGLELRDLDYVDIGELIRPAGVVPVVVKSLVFTKG